VEVRDGAVETRPGKASNPAMSLRVDAYTLIALLTGELTAGAALAGGKAALDGERKALARFVEAFAFGPPA
jgi:putative sterol carrier protein